MSDRNQVVAQMSKLLTEADFLLLAHVYDTNENQVSDSYANHGLPLVIETGRR